MIESRNSQTPIVVNSISIYFLPSRGSNGRETIDCSLNQLANKIVIVLSVPNRRSNDGNRTVPIISMVII